MSPIREGEGGATMPMSTVAEFIASLQTAKSGVKGGFDSVSLLHSSFLSKEAASATTR
jgi:hypothetical protein